MFGLFSRKQSSDEEMSFFEHLEILRFTLIRSIIAIMVFAVIAFLFKEFIFNTVILGPQKADFISNVLFCRLGNLIGSEAICINQTPVKIINIEIAGQFKSHLTISIIAGVVLAMPWILREIWSFVKPALKPGERSGYHFSLFMASMLFFIGVSFGYFLLSPITVDFLNSYELDTTIENQIRIGSYVRTISMLCLATGIAFEMPLVILFLTANRIVTSAFLRKYRKHVLIFFFVISAVITPPDVISQFLVAIPLFLLFELCIRIAKRMERRLVRQKEADI
ncbi:MAG TPA: twin-arginine translocase subunit TatC [Salinivirga sp.]|uniref:Sec-independent protein translocase protein TatC n=1 Tax=Salinivirga cyanobacteriivorans TaxID=1307839 RepID=A0A0S2I4R1_9BACT|nr:MULTISPECIES: twin-arginine translocase subunit TatC [Salinivirga]ALO17189.1 Sec-independent protein translocase protein TatCy [Salinivirga cyanobacteriivorans]HKK60825.1 twin-arginine translocase subunit TatC [Salinivirga sp.]